MAGIDEVEVVIDEESHTELRDALTSVLDALAPLMRDDRIKILTCARQFFGLPRSE